MGNITDQIWQVDGMYHRIDGPAIIYASGTQIWCQYGQFHRLDGPAIIFSDGTEHWYRHNKLHRLDGPAIVELYYTDRWHINDIDITKEVEIWLETNNITIPFTQEEQAQFILTFAL